MMTCAFLLAAVLSAEPADPWWSVAPLHKPVPPAVQPAGFDDWARNPIDRFILAKLKEKGLRPAPAADRATWLRRVSFDLTGLPPSTDAIAAFIADTSPDAFAKAADRLLASPHYGERWARHWMDIVHYAETHGHDQDRPRPNAWPYRDYIIQSFNSDKPYARFVSEQLAGDVIDPGNANAVIALGFLATGPWDESSLRDIRDDSIDRQIARYLDRDDMVTTALATFTSTSINCARCHDHKFDPISTSEYYGLQAVFAGVDKAERAFDNDPRVTFRRKQLLQEKARLAVLRPWLGFPTAALLQWKVDRQLIELPAQRYVYAAANDFKPDGSFRPAGKPRAVHMLRRGDIHKPGPEARPAALAMIPGLSYRFDLPNIADEGSRRAALARWITDPKNVLAWRSIVNRVWHYHFGRGIVDTPNDFGRMGSLPTHPELLDWLAVTFQESGGSLKHLHKLIVTSATYRQSTLFNAHFAEIDADNRYLWRTNRTRLDAESVRDALLVAAGKLDRKMGGPSVKQFIESPGIHVTPKVDYANFDVDRPENFRRSVYRFVFRTLPDPLMDALDCPDASQLSPTRVVSVSALQALAMLNNRFMVRMSEHVAARAAANQPDLPRQIDAVYQWMLGRPPSEKERTALIDFGRKFGLANVCRVVLNSNEFMFVN